MHLLLEKKLKKEEPNPTNSMTDFTYNVLKINKKNNEIL